MKKLYTVVLARQRPLWRGGYKWRGKTLDVDPDKFTAEQWQQILNEPLRAVVPQPFETPPAEAPQGKAAKKK